jgi:hypothetical protein
MGHGYSTATIECMMTPPGSGLVLTARHPADAAHPDDIRLARADGKGLVLRKPPSCTCMKEEVEAQWAECQRTGDVMPLARILVSWQEIPIIADACKRSLVGAAVWRTKNARGLDDKHCARCPMVAQPGQRGRLDIVHLANASPKSSFLDQALDIFRKIVAGLLNGETIPDALFELLAWLINEAF